MQTSFKIFFWTLCICHSINANTEPKAILADKILYKIGDEIITHTAIETAFQASKNNDRQSIIQEIISQKILLAEAKKKNIPLTKQVIESHVQMRLEHMLKQTGSEETLTDYCQESMYAIKKQLYENCKEQLLIEKMQNEITAAITLQPAEVKNYYHTLSEETLAWIPMKIHYTVYAIPYPGALETYKQYAHTTLLAMKKKILQGENFATVAQNYSFEDSYGKPYYTAPDDGILEALEESYANVLRTLSPGELSNILENKKGFYLIQLLERKQSKVLHQHIFIPHQGICQTDRLQGLYRFRQTLLNKKKQLTSQTIDTAAQEKHLKYKKKKGHLYKLLDSDYEKQRYCKSITDESLCQTVDTSQGEKKQLGTLLMAMSVGEITLPLIVEGETNKQVQIICLEKKIPAHRINYTDDYTLLYQKAWIAKKEKILQEFIKKKIHEYQLSY